MVDGQLLLCANSGDMAALGLGLFFVLKTAALLSVIRADITLDAWVFSKTLPKSNYYLPLPGCGDILCCAMRNYGCIRQCHAHDRF